MIQPFATAYVRGQHCDGRLPPAPTRAAGGSPMHKRSATRCLAPSGELEWEHSRPKKGKVGAETAPEAQSESVDGEKAAVRVQ